MSGLYLYLWIATFFIIIPLVTFYLVRGKKTTFLGKLYIFVTLTMFPLFFFGLSSGHYILSLISVCYFIMTAIVMNLRERTVQ
jgi:hypothetical protein